MHFSNVVFIWSGFAYFYVLESGAGKKKNNKTWNVISQTFCQSHSKQANHCFYCLLRQVATTLQHYKELRCLTKRLPKPVRGKWKTFEPPRKTSSAVLCSCFSEENSTRLLPLPLLSWCLGETCSSCFQLSLQLKQH